MMATLAGRLVLRRVATVARTAALNSANVNKLANVETLSSATRWLTVQRGLATSDGGNEDGSRVPEASSPDVGKEGSSDQREDRQPPTLSDEEERSLLEATGGGRGGSGRLLRLRAIKRDLEILSKRGFPLPARLSLSQWQRLLSLSEYDHRILYLDSIHLGEEEERYEEILASNERCREGLTYV